MAETTRRRFLQATAGVAITSAAPAAGLLGSISSHAAAAGPVRWGVVGTGGIANSMAGMIKLADGASLAAVSSRRMETAREYASRHGVAQAFDSWAEMAESDVVDALYVATPTSVKEDICIHAASNGKHVLCEKPLASQASVQRIIKACRDNDVAYMDGTHFPHHPRTRDIQSRLEVRLGDPWSVASAFQFNLRGRGNIRFNTELEPMGAIGDAGWYNMRAAVEYLPADVQLREASAFLRRDKQTGAAISGSGILTFTNGASSTWNCGFDSGAVVMDLRITGPKGVISIDDFLSQQPDGSADFVHRGGGWGASARSETISIPSTRPGAALMFQDFGSAVYDASLREQWMQDSERTQALLDAAWASALANENTSSAG